MNGVFVGYHSTTRGGYVADNYTSFDDLATAICELLEPFGLELHSHYGKFEEFPVYSVRPLETAPH